MAYIHHGTIRKYTAALLSFFNNVEVQHANSSGTVISKNIPLQYSTKEKSRVFDEHSTKQLMEGNYNVLPRANLSLSTLAKLESRQQNKNAKINKVVNGDTLDYQYNSVPYEFTFEYAVQCRGMNEVSQVIEQIAPKFNPIVNIDVWDGSNLSEPTRVPVKLLDIGIMAEEYEELSSNLITVSFGLSIVGNLYPPIMSTSKIKDFKIQLNEIDGDYFNRKSILGWDVSDGGLLVNETLATVHDVKLFPPVIIDIAGLNVSQGLNDLSVIYTDNDNPITELTFDWAVQLGNASITTTDLDKCVLDVQTSGDVTVQVTITDPYGNYATLDKIFTVI